MNIDFWNLLPDFGGRLRALSLAGGAKNILAWGIVLALTALPALGLLWRGRSKWDLLLLLAAGEIFGGLYFLVNPALLASEYEAAPIWGGTALWSALAALLAWAVLRWMGRADRAGTPGRTLEKLLGWTAAALGALTALFSLLGLLQTIQATLEANTAVDRRGMMPTCAVLILLTAADLLPSLLGYALMAWGGRLARRLEEDPFGEDTVAEAERLRRRCGKTACLSVLICAGGNLLQMLAFPALRSIHVNVSFPVATVLLAAALGLLCRYFRRAKAVSDDNETII